MIRDLGTFIEILRREGELVEVETQVSPHLEAAEVHRRVIEQSGPAILFRNIAGSDFPLVTNLFGTQKRIELAFGPKPRATMAAFAKLPQTILPPRLSNLWHERRLLGSLLKVGLKHRSKAATKEVLERPAKLSKLPLLKTWEQDGGEFITLPLVYTEHPETKIHNLGMYRMQRYDDASTGMHFQIGKGGGFHLAAAKQNPLPVNVTIGGPPALILSAIAPLPENVPELLLAALVLGEKLQLSSNPFGPLPVIADAEFTLVGTVTAMDMRPEGPFGDHYGYYSLQHDYPVFRCDGVLRKRHPICAATVVGKPRQEDFFLGDYLQSLLSPLFPLVMPTVRDLWSYGETGFHSLSVAVVQQRYKREAMVSAFRILGEGQLSLTKFLLVVDKQMDLRDFRAVLEYVLERADFRSDLYVFSNLAMDTLDYTGPEVNHGSKGVLLGVGEARRELLREYTFELPNGLREVEVFCRGCLVVAGSQFNQEKDLAQRLAQHRSFADWPLIILVDDAKRATSSVTNFLWTTFTRFEPAADIFAATSSVVKNHLMYDAPIVIDARMKPWYPEELYCDPETAALVDRRWREYFPSVAK